MAAEAVAHPLLFEPGTSGQYSNTGIDVGAAIVETVTHEKWDAFLKRRVLDPLGMTNTCFKPPDAPLAFWPPTYGRIRLEDNRFKGARGTKFRSSGVMGFSEE